MFMSTGKKHEVLEVGIFHPEETSTGQLYEGQVGYVVCNLKDFEEGESGECHAGCIGNTILNVGRISPDFT